MTRHARPAVPSVVAAATLAIAAAATPALAEGVAASPPTYRVTPIANPKWHGANCWGVNAGGTAVGAASLSAIEYDEVAFLATPGGSVRTPRGMQGDASNAYAINASGLVVGTRIYERTFGFRKPVAWDAHGQALELAHFGDDSGSAQALNDAGDIVGTVNGADGYPHAVLWADGAAVDLSPAHLYGAAVGINARRQVAVTADGLAYRVEAGVETPLGNLGGQFSQARGINAAGHVVGLATVAGDKASHAFLWKDGVMLDLAPSVAASAAWAVNRHDVVVGHVNPGGAVFQAVVWRGGEMRTLDDLLDPASGAGWHFETAAAINDAGQICADGNLGTALLTPVR